MACLPGLAGAPLRAKVLEHVLRRGPATITDVARDLDASRQQVATVVDELALLGVLRVELGDDKRARVVRPDETFPFLEALRILAVDAAAWYETPHAWQRLLARHYGRDWYIGGYAAVRRVLQPIDFEAPNVLVNVVAPERGDVRGALERAAGIQLQVREVKAIPPEVVKEARDGFDVWFATPERGFVEAWRLKEIPLYGLFLCLVQGLHDAALRPDELVKAAAGEKMEPEIRALLNAAREHLPIRELKKPFEKTRALKPNEQEALEAALNTVIG